MSKINWRTYKHPQTGHTVVEVCQGKKIMIASISPVKARKMSVKEFQRLLKRLQEAIEL